MNIVEEIKWNKGKLVIIGIILIIVGAIIGLTVNWHQSHTTTFTVEKTYIDNSGESSHYMIVTTDGRLYEMDNVWLNGAFGIDREWAKLEKNHSYEAEYCGWYIPVLDEYYIVYHVNEINATEV